MPLFAQVAPPLPVEGLFSYRVPRELIGRVAPGVRVQVAFGARRITAMCVGLTEEPPPPGVAVRPVLRLLEEEPLAGPDVLALSGWVARHTGCTWGEALDAALPRAVKQGSPGRTVEEVVLVGEALAARRQVDELQEKRPEQARALRILADRGGVLELRELRSLAHVSRSPVESLVRAGLARLQRRRVSQDPLAGRPVERVEPPELTADQGSVVARLLEVCARAWAGEPRTTAAWLLHGVTGSGKTEVYLRVLEVAVRAGRQGIVLVPEISLTPQTVRRFRERFERVAVLHSRLTDAERAGQWRAIRRGEADVVVGARSAVFAPVPRLGVIVLDEEHETSFKQQNVPRYHAREVAIERCRLAGAVCVLGTATPSLEAWQRSAPPEPRYARLLLPERVAGGSPPDVQVVDLTVESRRKGFSFLTDPLRAAIEDTLGRQGQVILFLNRRGWAAVLLCAQCRAALRCPNCTVSMTLHRRAGRVLCHSCGHEQPPPARCPACQGVLRPLGFGTEKVEEEVRQQFLQASVARMDSDTMSGRGSHEGVLDAFARGAVQVLVGTQMIAKGLDFPNALLVGVICADANLFLPDYRAAERTFQLLAQVVGRTGRGPRGGRVVVQAYDPRHFAVRAGMRQDMEAFARVELPARREAGFPPFTRLVRLVSHGRTPEAAWARVGLARDTLLGPGLPPGVTLLGPAPAPLERLQGQHRVHVVCKCMDDTAVDAVLARLAGQTAPGRHARLLVDVDPVTML